MYFRNLLCTVTFATLASAAVAKQIPTPYTSGQSEFTNEELFQRDAEAEAKPARTAAWEQAHGGPAPTYKYGDEYGEEHNAAAWHIAREANPMPEAEPEAKPGWADVGGNRQHRPAKWASRASSGIKHAIPTAEPFATKGVVKKYKGKFYHAREADGAESENANDNEEELEIPDFGDEEVDTSLEGLLTRRDSEGDDEDEEDSSEQPFYYDESQADLSGYDAEVLQRRSDGSADEIDYSLEGYEGETFESDKEEEELRVIQARDLDEDEIADGDDYIHSDEHRDFIASHGVTERSFADDLEDAEHARIDARDLKESDGADEYVPDSGGEEVDTSIDGVYLSSRDVRGGEEDDDDEVPDFGDKNVDVSLEGYDQPVLHVRGADDDEEEEEGDYYDADAAYAGAEVVEELTAPQEPEIK